MADAKLSALTAASSVSGSDLLYIVHAGTSLQATFAQVETYMAGALAGVFDAAGAAAAVTKTSLGIANVENTALSTWAGSTNLVTLGTIATGTWHGTAVADGFIASASTWNAKQAGPLTGDVTTSGAAATLANTAVTAGSYTSANITVDAKGRITAAANGSSGGTPGGSSGTVQYNNSGAFGGFGTWDGTTFTIAHFATNNIVTIGTSDLTLAPSGGGRVVSTAAHILSSGISGFNGNTYNFSVAGDATDTSGFQSTVVGVVTCTDGVSGLGALRSFRPTNAQVGTTYTLVIGDAGSLVSLSNAAAITLTVPTNASVAFPVGAEIDLAQLGAGQVAVSAAGGVTVNSFGSAVHLAGQYAGATLKKTATNAWLLTGNLS
jgi:hypothetical protein